MSTYLLLQSLSLAAALAAQTPEPPKFVRAYLEGVEVCFDSTAPIDWDKVSHEGFKLFPLASPSREALASQWNEISRRAEFIYDALVRGASVFQKKAACRSASQSSSYLQGCRLLDAQALS